AIAEYGHRSAVGRSVLPSTEVAAERGRRIEEAEEARAHDADVHLARIGAHADGQLAIRDLGGSREAACEPGEVDVSRVWKAGARPFPPAEDVAGVHPVSERGLAQHLRRPEEEAVDHREDRRVRADPEPQCENYH